MITRSAAKRQKVADNALFPRKHLPLPVVDQILECLDIVSFVQIAGCNSAWKKEIYDNRPELWSVIQFSTLDVTQLNQRGRSGLGGQPAARLTDRQLRALLQNCKAVERCKVLNLTGCLRIRGQGLDPLRGSCVLREIDLRLRGSANINNSHREVDADVVLPILSSMPPIVANLVPAALAPGYTNSLGLSLVKFNQANRDATNIYSRFTETIGDWLSEFHESLRRQAEEHRTACGYCHRSVMEVAVADGTESWKMGIAYCQCCQKYSCGDGSCPCTRDCEECSVQCCQPMGRESQSQCPNHKMIYSCQKCNRFQCEDCFDGFMCSNDDCCNEYCALNGCDDEMIRVCETCDDSFFCPECFEAHVCPGPREESDESERLHIL